MASINDFYKRSVDDTPSAYFFDVRDFGAVGDGVTDDTAGVQAAVDALFATRGRMPRVFFPDGHYIITDPITLPSAFVGLSIIGAGKRQDTLGTTRLGTLIEYTGTGAFMTIANASRLVIEDIGFKGDTNNTAFIFSQSTAGTGLSEFRRCQFDSFATGVQFGTSLLMSGCADTAFDFCEFLSCTVGVDVQNGDGVNYSFRRLYANYCPNVVKSVSGGLTFYDSQIVNCGDDTHYCFDFSPSDNASWIYFEGMHFELVTKSLIRCRGGRMRCASFDEAQTATGTTHFTLDGCVAEISHCRFTSGDTTTPLAMLNELTSLRPYVHYIGCFFDRAGSTDIPQTIYREIVGFTGVNFSYGWRCTKCTSASIGKPILDMGGRVQDGLVKLLTQTTNATATEVTTTGGTGSTQTRLDNQYDIRTARITVLGVSGSNYCRFIREIMWTTNSVLSDVTIGTDLDTIGVGGVAFTAPDLAGLRIAVTGKAATTIDWFATAEITSTGLPFE